MENEKIKRDKTNIPITLEHKEIYQILKKYYQLKQTEHLYNEEFTDFIIDNFISYKKLDLEKIRKELETNGK